MGILGQLFGTPPQLSEHHPIGVTTRTPTGQGGGSGTTFWNTRATSLRSRQEIIMCVSLDRVGILGQLFGTPPQLLEHHPIGATTRTPTGQGGGSGATFWNTRASNQTAHNTIYGEGFGATFGTPPHRAAGPRPREWDTFRCRQLPARLADVYPSGVDVRAFLLEVEPRIHDKLEEDILALNGIKFQLAIKVQLRKDNPDGSEEYTLKWPFTVNCQ